MSFNNDNLRQFTFIDLFSGAGGMSFGFASHPSFVPRFAVDAQQGKPSSPAGSLGCNITYEANLGLKVKEADLAFYSPDQLCDDSGLNPGDIDVLISGAPCTGFSRAIPQNHERDDPRNSMIGRTGFFVNALRPKILIMENVRELITGRFSHHWHTLKARLKSMGYSCSGKVYTLSSFGLPQSRERAIIIAAIRPYSLRTLDQLWAGFKVSKKSLTVRHAIGSLPPLAAGEADTDDPAHVSPNLLPLTMKRLRAIPKDGGSWSDLVGRPDADILLTPAMKRAIDGKRPWPFPDVYGRMYWDRPAPTIKRECSHVGNGRYSHPQQDRMCSLREMALLSGFPSTYRFPGGALANRYRHVGDACPPLISFQLAHICHWILTGERPNIRDCVLPNTTLRPEHISKAEDDTFTPLPLDIPAAE